MRVRGINVFVREQVLLSVSVKLNKTVYISKRNLFNICRLNAVEQDECKFV